MPPGALAPPRNLPDHCQQGASRCVSSASAAASGVENHRCRRDVDRREPGRVLGARECGSLRSHRLRAGGDGVREAHRHGHSGPHLPSVFRRRRHGPQILRVQRADDVFALRAEHASAGEIPGARIRHAGRQGLHRGDTQTRRHSRNRGRRFPQDGRPGRRAAGPQGRRGPPQGCAGDPHRGGVRALVQGSAPFRRHRRFPAGSRIRVSQDESRSRDAPSNR